MGREQSFGFELEWYICSERPQPFLSDLLPLLVRHRQLELDAVTRQRLLSQTKPASLLRRQISVIVSQWPWCAA